MTIRRKYTTIILSLILSVGLIFPFCCHAERSERYVHQQETYAQASHAHPDALRYGCGHQLRRDIQKSGKVFTTGAYSLITTLPVSSLRLASLYDRGLFIPHFLSLSNYHHPPLHLLNSVFLN